MIDTHSHIDAEEFAEDLEDVIARSKAAGIEKIFVPAITLKDLPHLLDVCKQHEGYLYPMVGLHPENILDEDYNSALDKMEGYLEHAIAVGEVGLDLYWDDTHEAEQIEVFERQIGWAEKYNLPLMIHARKAHQQLMRIMKAHAASNLRGVFHCFTGSAEQAKDLLSFPGFVLGIGGVLTFKNAKLPEALRSAVPLSRIVLETDAPYMAPVPHRGKRNESAFVREVAVKLAEIYETTPEEVERITTATALDIFTKAL